MSAPALRYVDTHLHLDAEEFALTRADVVLRAREQGVSDMFLPAVAPGNFAAVAELAMQAGVHPAFGIHPMYVHRCADDAIEAVRARLGQGGAVAVGEIGLDYFEPGLDRTRMGEFFAAQLRLARDFDLPVLLHVRRAQDEVLKQLRRFRPRGGIAHAFNGSHQQAEAFIALGFKLGFGGAMTYSGSKRIRELATSLPLEALVLETDGPDIPPAWRPQGPSLPEEIPRYASELASLRGISLAEVALQTTRNAMAVIGHPVAASGPTITD